MKSNLFKYIFAIFVIGIMIFAIFKIKSEEKNKEEKQTQITESEENRIKEINLGIAEYDTLNPIISKNKNVQDIQKIIYEPLINLTTEYKTEPCLAKEWAKQTETSYIIKLKEGVKWSDGTAFTAEDVRFTIDRLKDTQSIYSYNVQEVVQVEVVDELTLRISIGKEVPFFEYNLTFPIIPSANYSNTTVPIGTGKYKITQEVDTVIILEKNLEWWGTKNTELSLEKITINKYATLGEMYNAFKIGNIDMISTDNTNLQEYIGRIGYNEKQIQGREHNFLALNMRNTLLEQISIRKAISYSIDKENIVSSIFNNQYYTSSFPLEFGTWIYQVQNSSAGYNPDQGKQELIDNGWTYKNKYWQKYIKNKTQRIELNLLVKASDSTKIAIAENIKNQLEGLGIKINIIQANDAQYTNNLNTGNYDIALCSIYLSASPNMETFFGENNIANYNNNEVTEIMKEVKNTTDETALKKDYQRLAEIYKTEIPYISLYSNKYKIVYNSNLLGEFEPNWFSSFYKIETWSK